MVFQRPMPVDRRQYDLFSEIAGRKFFAKRMLSPYERRFLGTAGLTSWENAV
jgi:hypothetical protein